MIGNTAQFLLVIKDSDEKFEALCLVIQRHTVLKSIFRCTNGDEAIDFLYHTGAYEDTETTPRTVLILIDLNLPGTDGLEVIQQIKQDNNLKNIPVIVLTTSPNPKDIEICYQYSVASYILKLIDINRLVATVQSFITYWLDTVILPDAASK